MTEPAGPAHPEKVLWPQAAVSKADLWDYWQALAPLAVPHYRGRPLVLTRYPDGVAATGFYQKQAPPGTPPWVPRAAVRHRHRVVDYVLADHPAVFAWLADQAAVELHPWHHRLGGPGGPDWAVFDLDPMPPSGFREAVLVAQLVRAALDHLGLVGYPKTSGATGVHVYVPLAPVYPYRTVAAWVARVGDAVCDAWPGGVTRQRTVSRRQGKVYIDHLQNLAGKTVAGPYSPRAQPAATVSAPVTWAELEACRPEDFLVTNMAARVARVGDLFAPVLTGSQRLESALAALSGGPPP